MRDIKGLLVAPANRAEPFKGLETGNGPYACIIMIV